MVVEHGEESDGVTRKRLMRIVCFYLQAEDGIRDAQESDGLGDVYKRQGRKAGARSETGMERILLWSVLAFGVVGWLGGLLLIGRSSGSGGDSASSPTTDEATDEATSGDARSSGGVQRPFLLLAAALPFVVLLATLPSRPPFAAGQGFGRGFFWGGLMALLAGYTLSRACLLYTSPSPRDS